MVPSYNTNFPPYSHTHNYTKRQHCAEACSNHIFILWMATQKQKYNIKCKKTKNKNLKHSKHSKPDYSVLSAVPQQLNSRRFNHNTATLRKQAVQLKQNPILISKGEAAVRQPTANHRWVGNAPSRRRHSQFAQTGWEPNRWTIIFLQHIFSFHQILIRFIRSINSYPWCTFH